MSVKYASFGEMANNSFLLVDDKTNMSALIDCPQFNQRMIDLIGDTELKYILLTHGHYDHIIGAKEVKEKYGAKIAISAEDAPMLTSARESLAIFSGAQQNSVEPDIIIDNGDKITLGETEITVLKTPGHTKGSVCYMSGDSLFCGDTLFRLSCGRTDFPGGSWDEMTRSLKKISELDGDMKIYTGHDQNSSLDFEKRNNPYLKNL
ncbi:MAG: MBL fold metallo-hydrolase [Eubacterium sp.]|nr:MBL fold metallo-hydrolase [Eubacterium sp.]